MKKTLSNKEVSALSDGVFAVGGVTGLYIRKRNGKGQYFLRWKKDKKTDTRFYPIELSLKEARERAREDRKLISLGLDPKEEERLLQEKKRLEDEAKKEAEEKNKNTLAKVSTDWLQSQIDTKAWINNATGEKHARGILNKYIFPVLGNKVISEIKTNDIYSLLAPIWATKQGTADKTYSLLRAIFNWAIAKESYQIEQNPIDKRGALGVLLKPLTNQRSEVDNRPALDFHEIPEFIKALLELNSPSSIAVAFSILTASRFKAVRLAKWEEIDLEAKTWTIPEAHDKVKGRRNRQILLSDEAIQVLSILPKINEYLFPSKANFGPLSENAPSMLIRGMDTQKLAIDGKGWRDFTKFDKDGNPLRITQHGTARASFRTWAKDDELGNNRKFDQEAAEMCLLHSRKDAYQGAYDRSQLLKERRDVISQWGAYCFSCIRYKPK